MKTIILPSLAFAIACFVAGILIVSRPAKLDIPVSGATAGDGMNPVHRAEVNQLPASPTAVRSATTPITASAQPIPLTQSAPPPEPAKASSSAGRAGQGRLPGKPLLHDPLAREALAFVGADPMADEYWYAAINDPSLPDNERQDLIEDLNEDGLSDPKHPAPEDLPLILNRIRLIEEVWPGAPDQVALDACHEVYKDLVNLVGVAMGSGEQVK